MKLTVSEINLEQSLLQTLADGSADGICVVDVTGGIVLWSKALETLSGIQADAATTLEQVMAASCLQQILEPSRIEAACNDNASVARNRPYLGSERTAPALYEVHYQIWRAGVEILGCILRLRRQVSEVKLIDTHPHDERFKIMADCAPVMLWMSGTDSRCLFFNQPWLAFTGKSLDEEYGYGWAEGVHHEDFQGCIDTFFSAFNARREFTMEYRLRRHDGEYRWILDTGRPYYDATGEFAGFIGSCIDITSLRQAKQLEVEKVRLETRVAERERAARDLEEVNFELEAFSYSISHDLRAPLRAIDGFCGALSQDFGQEMQPRARGYVDEIERGAREMGRLIEGLLAFSRFSRSPIHKTAVDPEAVARRVIQELGRSQATDHVSFEVTPMPTCQADAALLKQVYMNLISNAAKYSSKTAKPTVLVGCQRNHDTPVYFVQDNGVGFDMQYSEKLFGVFQRLHSTEEFEGTGIGLAIIQRIIKRHGGEIWAEAQVDRGATFFFTLPDQPVFAAKETAERGGDYATT